MIKRPRLTAFVTAIVMTAACGGSTIPVSPTVPSGGSTTGATIAGRVNGRSSTASSSRWTPSKLSTASTSGPLTVSVMGTNISSPVDDFGQFTLTGVPAGTVRIQFTGPGTNVMITISGIGSDDRIEITVTLDGDRGTLESELVELQGPVSSLTGTCPALTFVVRGRSVRSNGATSFEDGSCTMIGNNTVVDVKGQPQADGSLLAIKVENVDAPR